MSRVVGPWSQWHVLDPRPGADNETAIHQLIRTLYDLAYEDWQKETTR